MKHAAKKPKQKTIVGVVPRKRHVLLIIGLVAVITLLVGGYFAWQYKQDHKKLTPAQQAATNSLDDQEKVVDQNKNQAVYIRTTSFINLSETYAVAGKCQEARDTLKQAEAIATSQSTKRIEEAKNIINSNC